MTLEHGSCVEIDGAGVLIRGACGAGKSDVALRLIDRGARLVADEYTEISVRDGRLYASAPETIRGQLEVRGFGVAILTAGMSCPLQLVVDLVPRDKVERLPMERVTEILGVKIPHMSLAGHDASTPAKIRLIMSGAALREDDDV